MSQRYITTLDVSQTDVSASTHETNGMERDRAHGNDLLNGTHPIKVMAYKVDTPLPISTMSMGNQLLNYAVELHIGEREQIGQGTFGY